MIQPSPLSPAELIPVAARLDAGGDCSRWEARCLLATVRELQAKLDAVQNWYATVAERAMRLEDALTVQRHPGPIIADIVVDDSLPPGTMVLEREGREVLRLENVDVAARPPVLPPTEPLAPCPRND